jgi:hypothetical protein
VQGHEEGQGARAVRYIATLLTSTFQISVQAADVKRVLSVYSVEVPAQSKDDLKEEPIVARLRKVCVHMLRYHIDLCQLTHLLGWRC